MQAANARRRGADLVAVAGGAALVLMLAAQDASASEACRAGIASQGRVGAIRDGRTLMLEDGRSVRLAGVELARADAAQAQRETAALAAEATGRDVTLHAEAEPDRYGRVLAFVYASGAAMPLQQTLIEKGALRVSDHGGSPACAAALLAAETAARNEKRGLWAASSVIKNPERPGDSAALVGRFEVFEGKVVSVRETGSAIYVNFGRRWSQSLTAVVAKSSRPALEAAGLAPKSLENRKIRIRGWVEDRGGLRIAAHRPEQIEIAD